MGLFLEEQLTLNDRLFLTLGVRADDASSIGKDYDVCTHNGKRNSGRPLLELALDMQERGAGEIVINSIDNDGRMKGYDLVLAERIRAAMAT